MGRALWVAATLTMACHPGARAPEGHPGALSNASGPSVRPPAGARVTSADTYQATISMNAATVEALVGSGYSLYGFKAIGASDKAGLPLVWLRTERYSLRTNVIWQERYEAYTSPSTPIQARASYPITTGQTLVVTHRAGTGTVTRDGIPGSISIDNRTTTPFVCGVSQPVDGGGFAPLCQLPLHGQNIQILAPIARVLLLFSMVDRRPGTAVRTSDGPGILIDFGDARAREVTFDIDAGWSSGSGAWGRAIPAGTDIVPLLVVAPIPTRERR